jgi:hypothetical protein
MQKSAAYEKLALLNAEIEQGIKNLSSESVAQLSTEIDNIKGNSFRDRAPEAELALQLFRKYADVANNIKDSAQGRNDTSQSAHGGLSSMLEAVPAVIYEGHRDELAGRDSFRKNIFWYRCIVAVLGLTANIMFITTPFINHASLNAGMMIEARGIYYYRCKAYDCMFRIGDVLMRTGAVAAGTTEDST